MCAQIHEKIIIQGKEELMAFCPSLPPNILALVKSENIKATACWRGYIATWEIKDDNLYLLNVEDIFSKIIFFNALKNKPILANWVSGTIIVIKGEMLEFVHMGFGSIFQEEIHFEIENGVVKSLKTISNENKDLKNENPSEHLPGFDNRSGNIEGYREQDLQIKPLSYLDILKTKLSKLF